MAEKYCDHGAYGASNRLGLDVPVWGVPQDGDGTAKTVSTTSGTAFISFSAAPTSGTISVCGVTVSTTGVLNAASADAAANALATNINATTTAVASGVSANLPQLRNLVYARGPSGGAPTGTCQIMMRVGSTTLNYANNATCLVATTFNNVSSVAANHQFVGGLGGCWGFLVNESALGVSSSIPIGHYGLIISKPIRGVVEPGDVVYLRGRLIVFTAWASNDLTKNPTLGTDAAPVEFRVDDGTIWAGDLNPVLEIRHSGGDQLRILNLQSNSRCSFVGKRYSTGQRSLVFSLASSDGYNNNSRFVLNSGCEFVNTHFIKSGTNSGRFQIGPGGANGIAPITYTGCKFESVRGLPCLYPNEYSPSVTSKFIDCDFVMSEFESPTNGIIENSGQPNSAPYEFIGCRFSGFVAGSTLMPTSTPADRKFSIHIVDCDLGGITGFGITHFNNTAGQTPYYYAKQNSINNTDEGRRFYLERQNAIFSWNPADNQPVLNSVLPNGVTKLSLMVRVAAIASLAGKTFPVQLPRFAKVNTLATAKLKVTVGFLKDVGFSSDFSAEDFTVRVLYRDAFGSPVTETFRGTGQLAVSTDARDWYPQNVGGKPFFGSTLFDKRKIEVTTSGEVASGAEVSVLLSINRAFDNTSLYTFFDMDPVFEAVP